jgi:Fe-S-cluster containining protein
LLLGQKVQAVEEVFALLDLEISTFQGWSKLSCKTGCGRCCQKPDVEATVLEFLPFAYRAFLAGEAFEWLERLRQHENPVCILFSPSLTNGGCQQYVHRGLICRLFGFSARLNKHSRKELVSCQTIKHEQAEKWQAAVEEVDNGRAVPVMSQYYMRLHAVDADLARYFFPVNDAIRRAIELVLHHFSYQDDGASAA